MCTKIYWIKFHLKSDIHGLKTKINANLLIIYEFNTHFFLIGHLDKKNKQNRES